MADAVSADLVAIGKHVRVTVIDPADVLGLIAAARAGTG